MFYSKVYKDTLAILKGQMRMDPLWAKAKAEIEAESNIPLLNIGLNHNHIVVYIHSKKEYQSIIEINQKFQRICHDTLKKYKLVPDDILSYIEINYFVDIYKSDLLNNAMNNAKNTILKEKYGLVPRNCDCSNKTVKIILDMQSYYKFKDLIYKIEIDMKSAIIQDMKDADALKMLDEELVISVFTEREDNFENRMYCS